MWDCNEIVLYTYPCWLVVSERVKSMIDIGVVASERQLTVFLASYIKERNSKRANELLWLADNWVHTYYV